MTRLTRHRPYARRRPSARHTVPPRIARPCSRRLQCAAIARSNNGLRCCPAMWPEKPQILPRRAQICGRAAADLGLLPADLSAQGQRSVGSRRQICGRRPQICRSRPTDLRTSPRDLGARADRSWGSWRQICASPGADLWIPTQRSVVKSRGWGAEISARATTPSGPLLTRDLPNSLPPSTRAVKKVRLRPAGVGPPSPCPRPG